LASNRSNVIALVLPLRAGMHVPVVMRFAVSVVTAARRFDHDVLLVTADEGPAGLLRVAASAMVDGLVLMDVELDDPRVPTLRALARPSVLIGLPADATGLTCVDLDFHRAGAECVAHLAALGHRDVALLGAPQAVYERGTGFAHRTRTGFLSAARALGMRAVAGPCEVHPAAIRRRVTEVVAAGRPGVTGLVVHNEAAVEHVLAVLRDLGRRVPADVSVVAICPDEVAECADPPLTSVQIPAEEVGVRAVDLLMRKLTGAEAPESTLLEPRLTVRASSVRAPLSHAAPGRAGDPAR